MLQIRDLTLIHKKDMHVLLKDFSFNLNKGDKAVLIGEEGNGKSTLLKLIYDERLVEDYIDYSGKIDKGTARIGYLPQELTEGQKRSGISDFCSGFQSYMNASPKERARVTSVFGFDPDIFCSDRSMQTLSGGEKVKLQLALIILDDPEIILLDEPSNDIDLEMLKWLEIFINKCDMPVIFVSHDETLIENTANTIIHMEQHRRKTIPRCTAVHMTYIRYIEERTSAFTHQEMVSRKEQDEYKKQMDRFMQIRSKVEHRQNTISRSDPSGGRLLKKKMKAVQSMGRRFEKQHKGITKMPETEECIMIRFQDGIGIPNGKKVLDLRLGQLQIGDRTLSNNINLAVTGPEKICITGKNGIGKTTLVRMIADMLLERDDLKAAYLPQDYGELAELDKTPVEHLSRSGNKEEITRLRTYLGSMKYTSNEMDHMSSCLSSGQKAKLMLLKMILDGNDVLILDEPTRNFSPLSNPVIREVLRSFKGAVISVSHDRKFIREVCDKVYEMTESGLVLL